MFRFVRASRWLVLVTYGIVVTAVPGCLIGAAVFARLYSPNHTAIVGAKTMPVFVAFVIHGCSCGVFIVFLPQLRNVRKERRTSRGDGGSGTVSQLSGSSNTGGERSRRMMRLLERYLYLYCVVSILSLGSWVTLWPVVSFDQCLLVSAQ